MLHNYDILPKVTHVSGPTDWILRYVKLPLPLHVTKYEVTECTMGDIHFGSDSHCIYIYIYIIQFLHADRISLTPPRARHPTLRKYEILTPLNPQKLPLLNPTSKCSPWCLMGPICSTCVHYQIHMHYMCKIDSQSVQPFDHISQSFEWLIM